MDKKTISKLSWLVVLIILIILGVFFVSYKNFKTEILIENETMIKIESTDTFLNLGKKMQELDTIYYKIYLKNNPPDFNLNSGIYQINGNIEKIFLDLQKPITDEINITILEGRNIFDIDEYLTNKALITSQEYIDYVRNPEKIKALSEYYDFLSSKEETLEGFLYPDTYKVKTDFKINEFVIQQLDTFETKVYNTILKDRNLSIETINDVVNLASIVEKEEKNTDEKPTVAGILKKRLNNNWQIGADITACYAYELTSQKCKMELSSHISEKNDYNTRQMTGLPKTPIGNPSFETINATLNDKKTEYWYYLHNVNTGKIYYAKTNQEHEANKQYMY